MLVVFVASAVVSIAGAFCALLARRPAIAGIGPVAIALAVGAVCVSYGLVAIAITEVVYAVVLLVLARSSCPGAFKDSHLRVRGIATAVFVTACVLPLVYAMDSSGQAFATWAMPIEGADGDAPPTLAAAASRSLLLGLGLFGLGLSIALSQRHWGRLGLGVTCLGQSGVLLIATFAWTRGETATFPATLFVATVLALHVLRVCVARSWAVAVTREFGSLDADEANLLRQ